MGLHDRLHRQNGSTPGITGDALDALGGQQPEQPESRPDPYAELKTRIHHACIAKLGPQLFSAGKSQDGGPEDLAEKVLRVVTEQLQTSRKRVLEALVGSESAASGIRLQPVDLNMAAGGR